jgi:hypothetical protein
LSNHFCISFVASGIRSWVPSYFDVPVAVAFNPPTVAFTV